MGAYELYRRKNVLLVITFPFVAIYSLVHSFMYIFIANDLWSSCSHLGGVEASYGSWVKLDWAYKTFTMFSLRCGNGDLVFSPFEVFIYLLFFAPALYFSYSLLVTYIRFRVRLLELGEYNKENLYLWKYDTGEVITEDFKIIPPPWVDASTYKEWREGLDARS